MPKCTGCVVDFPRFSYICCDFRKTYDFLVNHGVIKRKVPCPTCGFDMMTDYTRNYRLYCYRRWGVEGHKLLKKYRKKTPPKIRCYATKSIRSGTWLENESVGLQKTCQLIFMWLVLPFAGLQFTSTELQVNINTVRNRYKSCREVCRLWLEKHRLKLGGEGRTVELDILKMTTPKEKRDGLGDKWMIGGYDCDNGNCFVDMLPEMSTKCISKVVRAWVLPGTTLLASKYNPYSDLQSEDYLLQIAEIDNGNASGGCTLAMQSLWQEFRRLFLSHGRDRDITGYIAEFLFKQRFPNHIKRAHVFFSAVAEVYPPKI